MSVFANTVDEAERIFRKKLPSLLRKAAEMEPGRNLLNRTIQKYDPAVPPHGVGSMVEENYKLDAGRILFSEVYNSGNGNERRCYPIPYEEFAGKLDIRSLKAVADGLRELGI